MKMLSESIIGRKWKDISFDDLEYGDFVEISGEYGGIFLYVPQHVANKIFAYVDEDAFIGYSSYWRVGSFIDLFPYHFRKSHRIKKIIRSVSEDEYNNLKTKNDLFHLFNKYKMPIK